VGTGVTVSVVRESNRFSFPPLARLGLGIRRSDRSTQRNNTKEKMLLKAKKSAPPVAEGTYSSAFNSAKGIPSETEPKKIVGGYKLDGTDLEVFKEYSPSFEVGSPLRADVETLLGRELSASEAESFDLDTVKGKPCSVTVFHKRIAGGRTGYAVSLVLPAATN